MLIVWCPQIRVRLGLLTRVWVEVPKAWLQPCRVLWFETPLRIQSLNLHVPAYLCPYIPQSLGIENREGVDSPDISDVAYQKWVGKDYYNPFIKDFIELNKPHQGILQIYIELPQSYYYCSVPQCTTFQGVNVAVSVFPPAYLNQGGPPGLTLG